MSGGAGASGIFHPADLMVQSGQDASVVDEMIDDGCGEDYFVALLCDAIAEPEVVGEQITHIFEAAYFVDQWLSGEERGPEPELDVFEEICG